MHGVGKTTGLVALNELTGTVSMALRQDCLSVRYEQKEVEDDVMLNHARDQHSRKRIAKSVFCQTRNVKSRSIFEEYVRVAEETAKAENRKPD